MSKKYGGSYQCNCGAMFEWWFVEFEKNEIITFDVKERNKNTVDFSLSNKGFYTAKIECEKCGKRYFVQNKTNDAK